MAGGQLWPLLGQRWLCIVAPAWVAQQIGWFLRRPPITILGFEMVASTVLSLTAEVAVGGITGGGGGGGAEEGPQKGVLLRPQAPSPSS